MSEDPSPSELFRIRTEVSRPDDTVTVHLSGELDLLHADDLARHLAEVTSPGYSAPDPAPGYLVVDLSEVTFLSSRGLGTLVEAQLGRRAVRATLHLTGVPGNRAVERVIELAGLDGFFTIRSRR